MPGKIKVKVLAGRNLPVMDRAGDTTDAFVEIRFGGVTHKTDVCRKSLNPHWSTTEWYRFEVDESELQDEPLQLRLMDHDTYSANDAIGKVVISLAPLVAKEANNMRRAAQPAGAIMSGWIPVFDTMHGIRGELNIIVKVELFSDFNKYKNSSCGVQFFHCSMIPPGYRATAIHGFVEELVVNDDPEYQWIDKIRTPRASNEARQVAFIKLSNQVQRLVGVKAAVMGANAVVGYQQNFDLEGEAGVVARAIGTAISLAPLPGANQPINLPAWTQQQLRQYLDILATDADSITDLNEYFRNHQDELKKLLNILNPKTPNMLDETDNADDDEIDCNAIQQSSDKTYHGDYSIYQDEYASQQSLKHISDDQTELNKLLKGDANESDSDSSGPINKIKKLKTNFFSKRFGSTRSRKSVKQDDQVSIRSNSSDASRLSLTDIKNEFKKFKRVKKPKFSKKFTNIEDEGVGMASILARSVIHAHTSLACIAETQDSEQSPSSTLRRTSESEPTVNLSEDETGKIRVVKPKVESKPRKHDFFKRIPEIHTSLKNINSGEKSVLRRKLSTSCPSSPFLQKSENLLTLPKEVGFSGSLTISGESSAFSSSDEDDESSDQRTDTERSIETTSYVVSSVLKRELDRESVAQKNTNPTQNTTSDFKEIDLMKKPVNNSQTQATTSYYMGIDPIIRNQEKCESNLQMSDTTSEEHSEENKDATKYVDTKTTHSSRFKIHNPFTHKKIDKCLSAPSSPTENVGFVYRSSRKIKRQLSKISKISLSHYSLIPKKKEKELKSAMSQPGSSTEVMSRTPSDTVLGSPFLSYADLQSIDKGGNHTQEQILKKEDSSRVKMYIGSEPASRASISGPASSVYSRDEENFFGHLPLKKEKSELKPTGLVHTAIETILMDKVQSLLVPTSPEPTESKEKQFFDNVHKKLEAVNETRKKSLLREEQARQLVDDEREARRLENIIKSYKPHHKKDSLVHTAIETMLIDKVQTILPVTPIEHQFTEHSVFDDFPKRTLETRQSKLHSETDSLTSMQSKPDSLMQTAMKTILIDTVQSLVQTVPLQLEVKEDLGHSVSHASKLNEPSLLQSALETMLLEKIGSSVPTTLESSESQIIQKKSEKYATKSSPDSITQNKDKEHNRHQNLMTSAVETILLDKVSSLIPGADPLAAQTSDEQAQVSSVVGESSSGLNLDDEHHSLLHSAIETMLLEKVITFTPITSDSLNQKIPNVLESSESQIIAKEPEKDQINISPDSNMNDNKHRNLLTSAVETILLDKVSSLIPGTDPLVVHTSREHSQVSPVVVKSSSGRNLVDEHHSLLHSAIETMLLEKVSTLTPVISESTNQEVPKAQTSCNAAKSLTIDESLRSLKTEVHCKHNMQGQDNRDSLPENIATKKECKLVRQDSIHPNEEQIEATSPNISKDVSANTFISSSKKNPVLQHFHPILSGAPLETIPSLPETSFERSESLDLDDVDRHCDCQSECKCKVCGQKTNSAGVCDNLHVACHFDRSEMEKELAYEREKEMESPPRHSRHDSCGGREQLPPTLQQMHGSFNSTSTSVGIHRRSSDSDLSVTPKGGSLNTSNSNAGSGLFRPSVNRSNLEMLEYPFLTMTEYPPGFILHLGGTVCSRSVKLLDGAGDNVTRDAWWAELRTEVRSHARALRCNAVVAYSEECNIWEDVCVLSVIGTAALINLNHEFNADGDQTIGSDSEDDTPQESEPAEPAEKGSKTTLDESEPDSCLLAHVPYSTGTEPDIAELCGGCRKARVPAVLLATCSKPRNLPAYSKAITLTAVAARLRRAPPTSEAGARDVSDQLPFLEYELHKLLVAKLRMQGANALFSLQTQLTMGERYVIALASGTAVRLLHLPPPTPPTVKTTQDEKDSVEIQMALWDAFTANQASNGYDIEMTLPEPPPPVNTSQESEPEELPVLDLCADKDAFVLELDEAEEVESAKALAIRRTHLQVYTSDVKSAPNSPPQAFAQVWRSRLAVNMSGGASGAAERHVTRAMDGVAYKLRRLQPCAIMPRFQIELPEDEIQLVVWGAAIPLLDPNKAEHTATSEHSQESSNESHTQSNNSNQSQSSYNSNSQSQSRSNESGSTESDSSHSNSSGSTDSGREVIRQQEIPPNVTSDDDDIFALDEDQHTQSAGISQPTETFDDKMLVANGPAPTAVSLTTLPHVSGARATRRLCALRLLFVRETTAVRELGGLSGFLHTFTCEALAIARAYTAALGGNALTSFYINQLMLQDNTHKNQGQCLLSVGGDVVHVTF